jgi:hypothetical protein
MPATASAIAAMWSGVVPRAADDVDEAGVATRAESPTSAGVSS